MVPPFWMTPDAECVWFIGANTTTTPITQVGSFTVFTDQISPRANILAGVGLHSGWRRLNLKEPERNLKFEA
jgi:hypothetical protein